MSRDICTIGSADACFDKESRQLQTHLSRIANEVDNLVRGVGRSPGIIDNMLDRADTAQRNSNEVVELDPSGIGDFESMGVTTLGLTLKKQ